MPHWQDVIPERPERRPIKRPPLSLDWSRILTPPDFPTVWAYRAKTPDRLVLWAYRQGRVSWRWAVAPDGDLPLQSGLVGTKIDAQLAAENWVRARTIPQPTLFGGATHGQDQQRRDEDGGDVPF